MVSTVSEQLLALVKSSVRNEHPYIVEEGDTSPDVKLNQNESPFDLPEPLKRELFDRLISIPFNRYPREHPYDLRIRLAEHLNYTPEGIIVGNGSNELTYSLGLCLVDKEIPVVLPSPMFSLYGKVVRLFGGTPITIPCLADFRFDLPALISAVKQYAPPLTIITTPNNPTGLGMSLADIESLLQETRGFLAVDEAYVEFTEEQSALELLDRYDNLIVLRTFSKAFGLAGFRIGYMIAHPDIIREFMKSRIPFVVDRFAEAVALSLFERTDLITQQIAMIKRERDLLTAKLESISGIDVIPSQANFVLFKTPEKPDFLMKKLASRGVLVRNMGGYSELEGYLRVNAGLPEENKVFLNALEDALNRQ